MSEITGKIINLEGAILDDEKQKKLHGMVVCLIDEMKGKAEADERIKDILDRAVEELQVGKAYLKAAATELYKLEVGKLDQEALNSKEAAKEQIKEIYDDIERG